MYFICFLKAVSTRLFASSPARNPRSRIPACIPPSTNNRSPALTRAPALFTTFITLASVKARTCTAFLLSTRPKNTTFARKTTFFGTAKLINGSRDIFGCGPDCADVRHPGIIAYKKNAAVTHTLLPVIINHPVPGCYQPGCVSFFILQRKDYHKVTRGLLSGNVGLSVTTQAGHELSRR